MMNFSTKMITFPRSSTKVKTNFYANGKIINKYTFYKCNLSEEHKIVSFWKQLSENNEIEFIDEDRITTMGQVFVATEMSTQNITQFTQEILNYCKENLASYKVPQLFELVDALPRNPSGKLLKPELRERFPGPAPF